jgi:hypothetical protein
MFCQAFHKNRKTFAAVQKPEFRIGPAPVNPQLRLRRDMLFKGPFDFFVYRHKLVFIGKDKPEGLDLPVVFRDDRIPVLPERHFHVVFYRGFGMGIFDDTYDSKDVIKTKEIKPVIGTLGFKYNRPVEQFIDPDIGEAGSDDVRGYPL